MPKSKNISQFTLIQNEFKNHSNLINVVKSQISQLSEDLNQKFEKQEQSSKIWKSEIHDLIDSGFTSKAKKLDEEVDLINVRTVNLRQRTEKLEKSVFGKSL